MNAKATNLKVERMSVSRTEQIKPTKDWRPDYG